MHDPVAVKVEKPIKKLIHDGAKSGCGNRCSWVLSVPVYDLQEIMLGVFEDHEDALGFQDNLDQMNDVLVGQLGTQRHFADSRLGNAGVLQFAFFVWLESTRQSESW